MAVIPCPWICSNEEYHQLDGRWSSTAIRTFRQSRRLAAARYVTGELEPIKPTPAMELGTAVGHLLLGTAVVHEAPCERRYGKAWDEAVAAAVGDDLPLPRGDYEAAHTVARALRNPRSESAELAASLLLETDGRAEWAAKAEIEGVPVKVKVDKLAVVGGPRLALCELKTTSQGVDPESFGKTCANFGYHVQAALYSDVVHRVLGESYDETPLFFYIVVQTVPPYSVAVYEPELSFMLAGERLVYDALPEIRECLETGDWSDPWEQTGETIPRLSLPPWADGLGDNRSASGGFDW